MSAPEKFPMPRYSIYTYPDKFVSISVIGTLSEDNLQKLGFGPVANISRDSSGIFRSYNSPFITKPTDLFYQKGNVLYKSIVVSVESHPEAEVPASFFVGKGVQMMKEMPEIVDSLKRLGIVSDPYVADLEDAVRELRKDLEKENLHIGDEG